MVQIRSQKNDTYKEGKWDSERCEKHGKDSALYCMEEMCQKAVCISCLKVDYKKHEVLDIEEKEKELLMRTVKKIKNDLIEKLNLISETKKDIAGKTHLCVDELEEIGNAIQNMIEEAKRIFSQTKEESDGVCSTIQTSVDLLNNIQKNIEGEDGRNNEAIKSYRETVLGIMENHKHDLSGTKSLKFPAYNGNGLSTESISERLTEEEIVSHKCTGIFYFKYLRRNLFSLIFIVYI